jgi:hypothetical protein
VDSGDKLHVADDTPQTPQGIGYLRIPADTTMGYLKIKCYWTPTMPATILSPYAIGTQFCSRGYSMHNDFQGLGCTVKFHHQLRWSQGIALSLSLRPGLLFTAPFTSPTHAERSAAVPGPKLHAVLHTNAREGQVYHPTLSQTREGINDTTVTEAREGCHCLRHCISCPPPANLGESCLDSECHCALQCVSQEPDSYCLPCDTSIDLLTPDLPPTYVTSHLTRDQLRILWHQHLVTYTIGA